jgi:hypothetical protein
VTAPGTVALSLLQVASPPRPPQSVTRVSARKE